MWELNGWGILYENLMVQSAWNQNIIEIKLQKY